MNGASGITSSLVQTLFAGLPPVELHCDQAPPVESTAPAVTDQGGDRLTLSARAKEGQGGDGEQQDARNRERVQELKRTDREVRSHEQAHMAAAGQYAGGARYTFTTGPDGQQYAVGGRVSIDTTPVSGDPEATVRKAQTIRRAALAPADPSGADRAVAAAATAMETQAKMELTVNRDSDAQTAKVAQAMESGQAPLPESLRETERIQPSGESPQFGNDSPFARNRAHAAYLAAGRQGASSNTASVPAAIA